MDSKVSERNRPNPPASVSSDHKPAAMPGVGKHQSTCLPSAQARAACGRRDTPGQKNPSKLLLLDVCRFVTAETRRAKGLVLKERREMPEPGCCQLTCHSSHAAPGLAGWGEAGAGEPARPPSRGRGSQQAGSCLSCSSVLGCRKCKALPALDIYIYIFIFFPYGFHGGLYSGVTGKLVQNWKHLIGESTGLRGWGRPVHPPQPARKPGAGCVGKDEQAGNPQITPFHSAISFGGQAEMLTRQ